MSKSIIPTVNVFIINDNKVLLSRRKNTGWMDGFLCAPGGHVESGESPRIAVKRETKEELGLDLPLESFEFICVVALSTPPTERVAYEFIIRAKNLKSKNNEPDKCSELCWVEINHLPKDVIPQFRETIANAIINDQQYIVIGYK